jgi:cytochrome b561
LTFLGGAEVAPWIARSHDLGATIATIHGWLGDTILWLAGVHAIAALYHHFVLKDGVAPFNAAASNFRSAGA